MVTDRATVAPEQIDIPALREKYRQERQKRLRPEGQKQYVEPSGAFAKCYESDPFMPVEPRDALSEDIDVVILGAGFCGMLTAIQLKEAGVKTFRNIDWAGDWGGCWYWNRYPGIQCDNDAYCYLPLLEETGYMPSKKFADGWEIQEHCRRVANHYDLYPHTLFHTLVTGVRWDDGLKRWKLSTNRGDDIRARFVVMAMGPLNKPKLPGIPGMKDFKGRTFHTARWEYDYTGGDWKSPTLDKLADKRVAIIGTGATAIQVVPHLGRYAKQLYVIQRTPSSVDERHNTPTDPEWVKTLEPGWQKKRQMNFHHAAMERLGRGEPDMVGDIWTEISRNLASQLEAQGWPDITPAQYLDLRESEDYRVMERLRRRVDSIVKDKETAEALKPYYRFLCKRPCSNDDYYATFNRPTVKLIDVSSTRGLERMTEKGFIHDGVEYEIDCMILASGYEITSELKQRWGIDVIEGRNGLSIYDHWADGYKTLHGLMTHGFPNLFFTGFTQAGLNATNSVTFVSQGRHIGYIVKEALARGALTVEPSEAAQTAWVKTIRETANDTSKFARECTPGYFNNEGEEKLRWYLGEPYGAGFYAFEQLLRDWRDRGDLAGLVLEPAHIKAGDLSEPLLLPVEAYISPEYARAEGDKLWAKVWQQVGRVEEIPEVGNYITYDIADDSILVVRAAPDRIKAYHNVCPHRGRRLVDSPTAAHGACGRAKQFGCGYHAWQFNLEGQCTYILDKADWKNALTDERTHLREVKVDTWGGWIWINMDPNSVSLRDYLEPAASLLDPFEFEKMRYRFRQWVVFDCNWKVAIEAFMEPYHVAGTHPQLLKYGDFYAWSKAQGLHGNDGYDTRKSEEGSAAVTTVHRTGKGPDARLTIAQMQKEFWDTVGASTTSTLVNAAARLVDELPEGTPAAAVHHHWLESARRDDAARGVIWPTITEKQMAEAGLAWHIFPNMGMIPGPTFALYYRTRPYGTNPDKCIYEAVAIERFPRGQEPKTEWKYAEPTAENWRLVIAQDFSNMVAVQKGMKSRGFAGCLPNPHQERKVTNLHRNLAAYMGAGSPRRLE